jgi:lipopolysaccharide/colanic/teichoic acid biosynthesis glycosyltransferase
VQQPPAISSLGTRPDYVVTKRVIDVALTLAALVVLAPVFAAVALAVWLTDRHAPILFRQRRCGRGGETFELYKFRTMVANADELKEQLRHLSEVPWPDFRLTDDPRVTRTGRFLRKTSLDELPQLFNVLRGDMSLVGPRPTSFLSSTYEVWEAGRLDYQPGLTGPWQVYGRRSMDFDDRCRLEIGFFREPSIVRELWILLATVPVLVRRTGAS